MECIQKETFMVKLVILGFQLHLYDDEVAVLGDSSVHCDFGPPSSPEERMLRKSLPLRLTDNDPHLMVTAVKVAFDLRGYMLSYDCCFRRRVEEFRGDALYRAVCTHASRVFNASEIQRFGEQFDGKPVGYDILLCNAMRIEEEREAARGCKKVKLESPFKMDYERHLMIRQRFSD
uniref:PEROXIDASE_4 domain-containing protein n=1 Tax=Heterorhabditis bacteriophora TaxID=37862 RepID=A0A1I7XKE2_HETBA